MTSRPDPVRRTSAFRPSRPSPTHWFMVDIRVSFPPGLWPACRRSPSGAGVAAEVLHGGGHRRRFFQSYVSVRAIAAGAPRPLIAALSTCARSPRRPCSCFTRRSRPGSRGPAGGPSFLRSGEALVRGSTAVFLTTLDVVLDACRSPLSAVSRGPAEADAPASFPLRASGDVHRRAAAVFSVPGSPVIAASVFELSLTSWCAFARWPPLTSEAFVRVPLVRFGGRRSAPARLRRRLSRAGVHYMCTRIILAVHPPGVA